MPKRARTSTMLVLALLALLLVPLTATPASAVPPAEPVGLFPNGQNYGANPSLSWYAVTGARDYQLQYGQDPTFSNRTQILTPSTGYAPHQQLDRGTTYWRVRARNTSGEWGGWSNTATFTIGIAGPTPTAPANGAVLAYPTEPAAFSWTELPGARSYELEHDDGIDFIGASKITSAANGAILVGTPPFDQVNYWRVRAAYGGGIFSDWSAPQTYTLTWPDEPGLGRPTLVYPPYQAGQPLTQVTDVELEWEPVLGAKEYILEVSANQDFSNIVFNRVVRHTRYAPDRTLDNSSGYWWRVRARDNNNQLGPWSTPSAFARAWPASPSQGLPGVANPPALVSPAQGATINGLLELDWEPVDRASKYEVQFSDTPIFSGSSADCTTVQTSLTDCTPSNNLSGPTYYWRVRGIDEPANVIGLWSASRSFTWNGDGPIGGTFDPMVPVTYLGPADCEPGEPCSAHPSTPKLTWSPVPGANYYRLYVALDPNFTNIDRTYNNIPASSTPALQPRDEWPDNNAGQAYYWHVQPCTTTNINSCGPHPQGQTPPSSAFQKRSSPVALNGPGMPYDPVNPPAPETIPVVQEMPRFSWKHYLETTASGLDARDYRIQVSTSPQFTSTLENRRVDQPYFNTWDKTYPEGPIYWRVAAYDGSNNQLTFSQPYVLRLSTVPPGLTYPANGATLDGVPQFTWELIPHTRQYQFELYKNGDQPLSPGNRIDNRTTMFNGFTPYDSLAPGVYAWRVHGLDAQGKQKPWSEVRTFTVVGYAPDLLGPANGARFEDDHIEFTWEAEGNPAYYRFQRSTTPSFDSLSENQVTVMSTWINTSQLQNRTWYWRVVAYNASNDELGRSTVRSFVRGDAPVPCATRPFPDVPVNSSFCADIEWLAQEGIAGGYPDGRFRPTNPVSRQAMAAFLHRYTGQPAPNGPCDTTGGFPDVPANHQFCHEIMWMVGEGLSNGYPDGTFKPTNAISRQAMSAFLFRLAGQSEAGACPGTGFPDVPLGHSFCHEVAWMVDNDITDGYPDGTFKPTNAISRQAAAAFLHRFDVLP